MSKSIENMNKAELIERVTTVETLIGENVPALVVDWSPATFTASDFTADDLVERVAFTRTTSENVDGFLMLARSMTIWGAHFRNFVGEGKSYANNKALASAMGVSEGYVSKGRKIGRAYAEYGVQPGSELWTRITKFDLPEGVRKELGKSPEVTTASALATTRARWESEIAAYFAPALPPGDDENNGDENNGDDENNGGSGEVSPIEDVERLFTNLIEILNGADRASDVDTLEALVDGAKRLGEASMDALKSAVEKAATA